LNFWSAFKAQMDIGGSVSLTTLSWKHPSCLKNDSSLIKLSPLFSWKLVLNTAVCALTSKTVSLILILANTWKSFYIVIRSPLSDTRYINVDVYEILVKISNSQFFYCYSWFNSHIGLVISCYITKIVLPEEFKIELLRYLVHHQRQSRDVCDQGWGLWEEFISFYCLHRLDSSSWFDSS
jgi:hypothetical protein